MAAQADKYKLLLNTTQGTVQKGSQKSIKARGEKSCEMSSSGCDTAIRIKNSQQQQLSAQNWPVHSHS